MKTKTNDNGAWFDTGYNTVAYLNEFSDGQRFGEILWGVRPDGTELPVLFINSDTCDDGHTVEVRHHNNDGKFEIYHVNVECDLTAANVQEYVDNFVRAWHLSKEEASELMPKLLSTLGYTAKNCEISSESTAYEVEEEDCEPELKLWNHSSKIQHGITSAMLLECGFLESGEAFEALLTVNFGEFRATAIA